MPKPATAAFNGATACDIGVLASSGQKPGRHAFSAPSISPLKKSFWAKLKATMPGATTIM